MNFRVPNISSFLIKKRKNNPLHSDFHCLGFISLAKVYGCKQVPGLRVLG